MICCLSSIIVSTQSLPGMTVTAPLSSLRLCTPAYNSYSKIKIPYLDENRKTPQKKHLLSENLVLHKPGKSLCSPQSILFHATSIVDVHVRDTCLYIGSDANRNYYQYTWPNRTSASSKHTLSGPQMTDSGLLMHYQPCS